MRHNSGSRSFEAKSSNNRFDWSFDPEHYAARRLSAARFRLDFHDHATVDFVVAHAAEDAVDVFQPLGRVVDLYGASSVKLVSIPCSMDLVVLGRVCSGNWEIPRGTRQSRRRSLRRVLVCGGIEVPDHDAAMRICGEAPKGGPILPSGTLTVL